jgi:flavorubredoxin
MDNVLADGIYWTGVHFPEPAPGASLNSFVIKDEKPAVIDTGAPATAPLVLANKMFSG